ncbi:hypothetical protein [Paenibacillus sp. P46E]|uniref:YxiF family protein n=1 Tax=Paenibacillus sp. P46E TaxID=1349436 RepID=UPI00093FBAB6|nr:hypothetical protein [Paenibacillus sp. P46E]OKQ00002.1 hypothetical protein A3849_02085 [Paenibacillus sp. P46E]
MGNNRENLRKLLSLNKAKQSRVLVIQQFFELTGMHLSDEQFLSPNETTTARTMIYKLVKDNGNTQQLKRLGEVIEDLKTILGSNQHLKDEKVIILHYQDATSGAIIITFSEFLNHIEEIIEFLSGQDVVVFQIDGDSVFVLKRKNIIT